MPLCNFNCKIGYVRLMSLQVKVTFLGDECFGFYRCDFISFDMNESIIRPNYYGFHTLD